MSEEKLQFQCPHCQAVLHISARYLGQNGKCNKCGGRIALIGEPQPGAVQMASLVDDGAGVRDVRPASGPQQAYMRKVGVPEDSVARAQRHEVSTLIQAVRADLMDQDPPSQAQMELLKRLGCRDEERALVRSRAEAAKLIATLQPKPTDNQIQYLQRLGATPDQLARVLTRSEASELIEHLLRNQ